jgi:paraquat-inducible protein B
MNEQNRPRSLEDLPKAIVQRNWKTGLFWLIPLAAAGLAGYFVYTQLLSGGPEVQISFDNAQGLQAGKSDVKYRGAEIGTVKNIQLAKDAKRVNITISLIGSAADVARDGSRFWIVKPEIGIEEIRAPRTIVSGNYITVEPGRGKRRTTFIGLAEPPIVEPEGALRVVLFSERLGAIKKRSPIFYRGIQVGKVFDAELGPESQTIHILADIQKHYRPLLRMNSKFWNAGGIHVNIGLTGADVSAQSAETLVSGGIDFATPDTTEKEAPRGTAFRLYDKPEDAWLAWAPRIKLGEEPQTNGAEFSQNSR